MMLKGKAQGATELEHRIVAEEFAVSNGILEVGGIPVTELARTFGTPLFVYDADRLRRNYRRLSGALAGFADVYYSIKANPLPAVASVFVAEGAGLEIASIGEFRRALDAGCEPQKILFAGPGKGVHELEEAIQGEVGEIVIRADVVMKGYWNKPEATAETIRNGWLHTGDAAYQDADGFLFIYDRVKDLIVSGGENVYPAEVENAIFGHPQIADVAVIGVPDDKWGEAVKAIVVLKAGETLDPASVIAWARERIANYKVPKTVDVIAAIPRNPSGKILRRELRKPYWEGRARQVS